MRVLDHDYLDLSHVAKEAPDEEILALAVSGDLEAEETAVGRWRITAPGPRGGKKRRDVTWSSLMLADQGRLYLDWPSPVGEAAPRISVEVPKWSN
jgi:hypothetical protein